MKCSRRNAIKTMALIGSGLLLPKTLAASIRQLPRSLKFGVITDTHIGFVDDAEARLDVFLRDMKTLKPTGLIQMGDFAYPNDKHQQYVDRFNEATDHAIHAIGNHELDLGLTREHAKKSWDIPSYYYSKEVEGLKIIVLDGNDRGSPTYETHGGYHSYIGKAQREWLAGKLETAEMPVLVISHQPLAGRSAIDNAQEVQEILEPHKNKILVCLNGHSHVDQHLVVNGINHLHINSASYYWLGGTVRLAAYKDPLYTTMTIDANEGTVSISASVSSWESGTPEDAGYFNDGKNQGLRDIVQPRISPRTFNPDALHS